MLYFIRGEIAMGLTTTLFIIGGAGVASALFLFGLSWKKKLRYNPWIVILIISACILIFGFLSIHSSL
jgi:hypothetical protein